MTPEVTDVVKSALLDLIESSSDAILITSAEELDRPGPRIIYANPAFCSLSGYDRDQVIGKSPRILQGPGTSQKALGRIAAALRAGEACREELLNYSQDGTPYWLDIRIVPLRDDTGVIRYFGAIERDITNKVTQLEYYERLAHEDVLTGIANRAGLEHHLQQLGHLPEAATEPLCLLLFDLDGFKGINDTLGHVAGDNILRDFAALVTSKLRRDDFLARLGGDEFIAVLRGYTPHAARQFAEEIVRRLASLDVVGADKVSVSVGMTFFSSQDVMEEIIDAADRALYHAKDAGKGQVHVSNRPRVV